MPQQHLCLSLRQVRYAVGSARSAGGVTEILSGVDVTAHPGQVTVIIGPNGAGKTTTLNCAQGLVRPRPALSSCWAKTPIEPAPTSGPGSG